METVNSQAVFLYFVNFSQIKEWDVKRYANHSSHQFEKTFRLGDLLQPFKQRITHEQVIKDNLAIISKIDFSGNLHLRERSEIETYKGNVFLVPKNHLIYSKINVKHGCIYFNNQEDFVVSNEYPCFSFDTEKINGYFLILLLRSDYFKKLLNTKTNGIGKARVKSNEFLDLQIPLPDINTQKSLVQAYQEKMAKADELEILANQNFSGCLDEMLGINSKKTDYPKSKLIFTNFKNIEKWGVQQILNPEINFSNLYPVKTIQELCKVGSGGTPNRSRTEYYQGSIPWVKTGEVVNDVILDTEEHISEQAISDSSAKLYPAGSLIIAMYGQGLTRGRTAKLGVDATTNQACAVLSEIKTDEVLTDYLWVYLMNEYDRLRALASGNNQPNLNGDMIKNYPVVIPDLPTQTQIATHIQAQKQQQKSHLTTAAALRLGALTEFEQAIFSNKSNCFFVN